MFLRRYDGSGSLNAVANWTPAVRDDIASGRTVDDLVGGPGGAYLLETQLAGQTRTTTVRRLTATGSGPSIPIGTDLRGLAIVEDPTGAVHVVYEPAAADLDPGTAALRWRTSTDGGATFGAPVTVYRDAADPVVRFPTERGGVAITGGGHGWAVLGTYGGTNAPVRALELSPVLDAPPPMSTTTTTPPPPLPPPPPADTAAPVLTGLRATPATFRLGAGATPFSFRKAVQGTQLRFALSEPAEVRLRLLELGPGLRAEDGNCSPQTAKALRQLRAQLVRTKAIKRLKPRRRKRALAKAVAKHACRAIRPGGLDRSLLRDTVAGANAVAFTGRIQGSDGTITPLAEGTGYRIVATATDAAGNRSRPGLTELTVAAE